MKRKENNSNLAVETNFRAVIVNTKKPQKGKSDKSQTNTNKPYSQNMSLVKTEIFGIGITNTTGDEVLEYIVKTIKKTTKKLSIVTPNPEILMLAKKNAELKIALNEADIALCDGVGLFVAAKALGKPLKERIIGTNVMEKLCQKVADWPITVGFLGARPGVAAKAAECLLKKYPNLHVVFTGEEWPEVSRKSLPQFQEDVQGAKKSSKLDSASLSEIRSTKLIEKKRSTAKANFNAPEIGNTLSLKATIDILFVAFGAPKQELWMKEHINKIPVRVMMGVGGAFDQIANPSLRPPEVVHRLGLGWLYRLMREPWRLKRQFVLPLFAWEVVKEKFASGKREP